jgi:hypothetical protein
MFDASRVLLYLPASVSVGIVAPPLVAAVVPSAYQLAVDTKLVDPPPATLAASPILDKEALAAFTLPIGQHQQLPYSCSAVNGALLRVNMRTTTRRLRHKTTNEVVSESTVGVEVASAAWLSTPVTRECRISRPMDYIVTPHSDPQIISRTAARRSHADGAVSREGDLFAPRNFVSPRILPSFDFTFDVQERRAEANAKGKLDKSYMAVTCVQSTEEPLPPARSPKQLQFVEAHRNTPESKVLLRLLAERPIWSSKALLSAMTSSGQCPTHHLNITMVKCYTYSIAKGPFHGLRISFDCDPTSSEAFAVLQPIVIRVHRTDALGVAIRDTSRMHNVKHVLERCPPPESAPNPSTFLITTSMQHFTRRLVVEGGLWSKVQIMDLMDHPAFAKEAQRHISFAPQFGFYTEESLRALARIVEDQLRLLVMTHVPEVIKTIGAHEWDDGDSDGEREEGDDVEYDGTSSASDNDDRLGAGEGRKRRREDDDDEWDFTE